MLTRALQIVSVCPHITVLNVVTEDPYMEMFSHMTNVRSATIELEDCFGLGFYSYLEKMGRRLEDLRISCSTGSIRIGDRRFRQTKLTWPFFLRFRSYLDIFTRGRPVLRAAQLRPEALAPLLLRESSGPSRVRMWAGLQLPDGQVIDGGCMRVSGPSATADAYLPQLRRRARRVQLRPARARGIIAGCIF